MFFHYHFKPSADLSPAETEGYLRERIYGALTILAVNIGLLLGVESLSVSHAYLVITSTALGLWLASLFSAHTAYRLAHDKPMPRKLLLHELTVHRGLLIAAIPSLVFLFFAAIGFVSLASALIIDILLTFAGFAVLTVRSSHVPNNRLTTSVIITLVQISIAGTALLVKLSSD